MRRATEHVRFGLALAAVAAGAAAFAIAFRESLALVYVRLFRAADVLGAVANLPTGLRLVIPAAAACGAGFLAGRVARGQGVSNVMEAVALGRVQLSMRATTWRSMGAWLAMTGGLSVGREGPLIEFGGSLGAAMSSRLGLPLDRLRALVAAGTAAGFAAAYNTPFAAILFVLETIVGIAALDALLPMIGATVIATTLTRAVAGGGPIYGNRAFALGTPLELAYYVVLGALAAGAGALFKASLAFGESFADRVRVARPWKAGLGGLIVGVIAIAMPHVAGNGYEALNGILDQPTGPWLLGSLLVLKVVATSASVASGVPGGIFTPVLLVGGATGAIWGHVLAALGASSSAQIGGYALVGMAATSAATTHAPLTAAVMVFELSGDYPIAVPLLLATVVSTALSRWSGSESVYTTELQRRGVRWALTLDGRHIQ
ncbi:MAG: chloride channel protein [Vicinamibacterales bacterium]